MAARDSGNMPLNEKFCRQHSHQKQFIEGWRRRRQPHICGQTDIQQYFAVQMLRSSPLVEQKSKEASVQAGRKAGRQRTNRQTDISHNFAYVCWICNFRFYVVDAVGVIVGVEVVAALLLLLWLLVLVLLVPVVVVVYEAAKDGCCLSVCLSVSRSQAARCIALLFFAVVATFVAFAVHKLSFDWKLYSYNAIWFAVKDIVARLWLLLEEAHSRGGFKSKVVVEREIIGSSLCTYIYSIMRMM